MNRSSISIITEQEWSRAQDLEFAWWANLDFHATYRVFAFTHLLLNYFGISLDQPHKVILDVGCGPIPRVGLFRQATLLGLDPLLEKYRQLPYQTLDALDQAFPGPIEKPMPALEECADFILCVNVLDHSYDAESSLSNCAQYLKPNGLLLLSFDLHPKIDDLHPLCIDKNTALQLCSRYFDIESYVMGLPWKNKSSYHGDRTSRAITLLLAKKGQMSWWRQFGLAKDLPFQKDKEITDLIEAKLYAFQDAPPIYPSLHRLLRVIDACLSLLEYYPLMLFRHFRKR